jgi:Ni/Co efflux regulator RcnB
MKRAAIGVLLVSLLAGSAAMAGQGYRGNPDYREPPRASDNDHHDNGHHDNDHRDNDYRDHDRRDNDHRGWDRDDRDRGHDHNYRPSPPPRVVYRPAPPPRVVYRPAPPPRWAAYSYPRGYYGHSWHRGERLPVAYYEPRYVIGNYHDCGLRAPPYGYHWVRVNNDAVLAAVATGVVLDVTFHLFG